MTLEEHVIYEPEQFPGAIFRILEPFKSSVLIFSSGKIVVTGLTSSKQIDPIIERLTKLLE